MQELSDVIDARQQGNSDEPPGNGLDAVPAAVQVGSMQKSLKIES